MRGIRKCFSEDALIVSRHAVVVLRFWNHQVRHELDSVLPAIWFALDERSKTIPHLNPLGAPPGRDPKGEANQDAIQASGGNVHVHGLIEAALRCTRRV